MPDLTKAQPGWYCFKALPKKEHIAAGLLRRIEDIEAFCPRISKLKKTRRGKVRFVECLFPGYIFVHADLGNLYRRIRATQGIRDVVSFGDRLPVLPGSFIEELRQYVGDQEIHEVPEPELQPGQAVVITEGPFKDLAAVVSGQLDAHQRVALLLEFLGRQMEIHMPAKDLFVEDKSPHT